MIKSKAIQTEVYRSLHRLVSHQRAAVDKGLITLYRELEAAESILDVVDAEEKMFRISGINVTLELKN